MSQIAVEETVAHCGELFGRLEAEMSRMIVGQADIIRGLLTALLADGNVLLEGVPGLGKTLLVRTLAEVIDVESEVPPFTAVQNRLLDPATEAALGKTVRTLRGWCQVEKYEIPAHKEAGHWRFYRDELVAWYADYEAISRRAAKRAQAKRRKTKHGKKGL